MKLIIVMLWVGSVFGQAQPVKDVFSIARKGTVADVQQIFKTDKNAFNVVNNAGFSPLIIACYNNNNEVAKALIESGADINGTSKMGTPLMAAVVKNNLEIVKLLLEKKANINAADDNGITALIYAVQLSNIEITSLLLSEKADTTIKDKEGKTAFEHAITIQNEEIINLLKQTIK